MFKVKKTKKEYKTNLISIHVQLYLNQTFIFCREISGPGTIFWKSAYEYRPM